jgi:predicted alpha/beta-fold hydrolase
MGKAYWAGMGRKLRDVFLVCKDVMAKDARINVQDVAMASPVRHASLTPVDRVE